ncbi:DUF2938 domain-containing protein [Ahrensia marina]|uniref:DUF2938 domain-containing protein n=1 Tax=Ahrensia marina TaxID=1514904 RepID=UPI0035CEE453
MGATLFMDFVALVQKHILAQLPLNYAMVGRWIGHMFKGRFIHQAIPESTPIRGERLIGWISHYLIGIIFAVVFLVSIGDAWMNRPTPLPAALFGVLTVLAPFLILQPAFGAGLAASCAPRPVVTRARSVLAHLSFGVGLWISALCLSALAA